MNFSVKQWVQSCLVFCFRAIYDGEGVGGVRVNLFQLQPCLQFLTGSLQIFIPYTGIYRNQSYPLGIQPPGKEQLCGHTELRRFCDRVSKHNYINLTPWPWEVNSWSICLLN